MSSLYTIQWVFRQVEQSNAYILETICISHKKWPLAEFEFHSVTHRFLVGQCLCVRAFVITSVDGTHVY